MPLHTFTTGTKAAASRHAGCASLRVVVFVLVAVSSLFLSAPHGLADESLQHFLSATQPNELIQGADAYGTAEGSPPLVPVLSNGKAVGYAYLNTDFTSAVGYSGKPIRILVGIDPKGVVRGIKLVEHKEPIVLIGIPQEKVVAALNSLIGKDLGRVAAGQEQLPQVDIVSGATVTVLVMSDSVVRSAVKLIRSGRLGQTGAGAAGASTAPAMVVDPTVSGASDWSTLVGDGSVRSLRLTVGEVTKAFADAGQQQAAERPETGNSEDRFIDLYVAPVSVPAIGRSLLGDAVYDRLQKKLKPGQQAVVVAGEGAYSFKGSGYVRGGIFDRIELMQDGQGVRFRDRNHTRLGDLAAEGAPHLREIALFTVPDEFALDLSEPWELQLLVQRSFGARQGHLAFRPQLHASYPLPEGGAGEDGAAHTPGGHVGATGGQAHGERAGHTGLRRGRALMGDDLEAERRQDRRHRRRPYCAHRHLLLPELAGKPAPPVRLGQARLPFVHAGMARLVRQRPAFRR